MESTVTRSRITILANLLVNDAIKEKRFLRLIETLCKDEFFDFSIRLRGNRAEELEKKISILLKKKNSPFNIRIGENVKNWKLNSLIQTFDFENEYFLLLNEDHFPNTEKEILREYLQQCVQANIDVSSISFYPSYEKLAEYLASSFDQDGKIFILGYLTSEDWKKVPKEAKNYPISLLGMYKKDFLRKLLKSRKPLWRRYPFNSPFDFEQSGKSGWIFPFSFALPAVEIFACIDDDCGIHAYSLISRGIYREDTSMRVPVHHKYGKIEQKFVLNKNNSNAFNITQRHSLTFVILRRLFNLLRLIRYSIHGFLTWDYQKAKVRYIINRGYKVNHTNK